MKYSLRSLMIVAAIAPALLAGLYFAVHLALLILQLPRLDDYSPAYDPENDPEVRYSEERREREEITTRIFPAGSSNSAP